MTKLFIVWNERRNEAFVTDEESDAQFASDGCRNGSATCSALADDFFSHYAEQEPKVEELSILPNEITPAIKDALQLMLWHSSSIAEAYRAGGVDIPHKAEEEQSFVLFKALHFAIAHGDGWRPEMIADIEKLRDATKGTAT